jgi:hypothetical protein
MKPTLNEKFIAYLTLLSGLSLSAVAVYYSVVGLTAIFAAAVIPIIIMGTTLEISKLVATIWLKQNWKTAPLLIKTYLFTAIVVLMIITSMGIFGFLSKAHSDQNLVSGDVLAKIAVYDEKIKTSKDNIDVNRKQLKQMDEAVDQVMGRSADEKGADKAVALRRGQAKDRARLLQDIDAEQKTISSLNEERAPIAAEVRKVEAEVGPIKYIAAFFYGSTDPGILEKAVTWVIITLIVVFDPLAVILLLASQMSFQEFREREGKATGVLKDNDGTIVGLRMPKKEVDYSKKVMYKIVCNDLTITDCYIGHTTNFTKRKYTHKHLCNIIKFDESKTKKYNFIREHGGWSNWSMIEIEKYPCSDGNEARERERYWFETLSAKLNDEYPSRSSKEYKAEYYNINAVKLRANKKEYYEKNKEELKLLSNLRYHEKKKTASTQ